MQHARLRGIVAATATPVYPDFTPDCERLLRHCRALLDNGCDAINLLGTTGEATAFSVSERLAVMGAVAASGLPLSRFMAGTGVCSLAETVRLTRAACEMGFAGALVLPPFYYPNIDPAGLIAYMDALITRVNHPACAIYLYHIPQNTGVPWPIDVVATLRQRHADVVVGLKDSAGDIAYARAVARALPGFDVFPSSEAALAGAREDGFAGCISATTNLTAPLAQAGWSALGTAAAAAAFEKAGALRAVLARGSLIANVKAALANRYHDDEWSRLCPPLLALSPEQAGALHAQMQGA